MLAGVANRIFLYIFFFFQVTKNERQIMKPLYDRYRLVKQILCRASTIPVIVSIRHLPFTTSPPHRPAGARRGVQTLTGT